MIIKKVNIEEKTKNKNKTNNNKEHHMDELGLITEFRDKQYMLMFHFVSQSE